MENEGKRSKYLERIGNKHENTRIPKRFNRAETYPYNSSKPNFFPYERPKKNKNVLTKIKDKFFSLFKSDRSDKQTKRTVFF